MRPIQDEHGAEAARPAVVPGPAALRQGDPGEPDLHGGAQPGGVPTGVERVETGRRAVEDRARVPAQVRGSGRDSQPGGGVAACPDPRVGRTSVRLVALQEVVRSRPDPRGGHAEGVQEPLPHVRGPVRRLRCPRECEPEETGAQVRILHGAAVGQLQRGRVGQEDLRRLPVFGRHVGCELPDDQIQRVVAGDRGQPCPMAGQFGQRGGAGLAARQLRQVGRHRGVQGHLAALDGIGEQQAVERLRDRAEFDPGVGRHLAETRPGGGAVLEAQGADLVVAGGVAEHGGHIGGQGPITRGRAQGQRTGADQQQRQGTQQGAGDQDEPCSRRGAVAGGGGGGHVPLLTRRGRGGHRRSAFGTAPAATRQPAR